MMKKVFAVALASCMIFSSATVFAADSAAESTEAEAEVLDINWEDVSSQDALAETLESGDFYVWDDLAIAMWVPNAMAPVELTDEDIEAGYVDYFATEDQSCVASMMYVTVDGVKSVEDYAAIVETLDGVSDIEFGTINELPAVSYMLKDSDTACVAFASSDGEILEYAFYPASDEEFSAICALMTSSIQAYDEEAFAESEAESVAESTAA